MLRHAAEHQPDALRLYLTEAMRPGLEPIVDAIHRVEDRG